MTSARAIALLVSAAIASSPVSRALAAPADHPAAKDLVIVGEPPPECYVEDGKQNKAWFEAVEWKIADGELGDVLKALSKLNCRRYLVPKSLLNEKVHLKMVLSNGSRTMISNLVLASLQRSGFESIESMPLMTRKPLAREADPLASAPPIPDEQLDKDIHCKENRCTIARALADRVFEDSRMLATSARVVPSFKDGKPTGFKVYAIRPMSLFGRIGVQNGDTILTINGFDLSTPDQALAIYTKLREAKTILIEGLRRGEPFKLELTVQ